jgi:hypothetical protein
MTDSQTAQLAPVLAKALSSLEAAMIKAHPAHAKPTEAELLEKLFQFPLWPEPVRGMPNLVATARQGPQGFNLVRIRLVMAGIEGMQP